MTFEYQVVGPDCLSRAYDDFDSADEERVRRDRTCGRVCKKQHRIERREVGPWEPLPELARWEA